MNDIKLYKCYSENQMKWLLSQGFRYILKAKDYKNLNDMWLFLRDNLLEEKLQIWHDNNPKYINKDDKIIV